LDALLKNRAVQAAIWIGKRFSDIGKLLAARFGRAAVIIGS
jgi:hypothetical protein